MALEEGMSHKHEDGCSQHTSEHEEDVEENLKLAGGVDILVHVAIICLCCDTVQVRLFLHQDDAAVDREEKNPKVTQA